MSQQSLGRLSQVELRKVWANEPRGFTPWLADKENLKVLGDTLNLELELEEREKKVGRFNADIVCKDLGDHSWVLIENQLEGTDHNHLGQLLTYASVLEAVTIVWIAKSFTDEHRSALDWLNKITNESVRFFGLEMELWRIGDSLPAPKFNIISKPNDWSRSVARTINAELSDTRSRQRDYWEAFHQKLDQAGGPVRGKRVAQPQAWMDYAIGRSGFQIITTMIRQEKQIRVELNITGGDARAKFNLLREKRHEIENNFCGSLEWEELPGFKSSRIAIYMNDVDPENEADWLRQHTWFAEKVNEFHRVFSGLVRNLNAEDWQEDDSGDCPEDGIAESVNASHARGSA